MGHLLLFADAPPDNGFVPNTWRDVLTIAGLTLTLLGLAYTIYQVRRATSAADAAKNAAEATRAEARDRFRLFTGVALQGMAQEAIAYIEDEQWGKATLRLDDLAEEVSRLGDDSEWDSLAGGLRDAANECRGLDSGRYTKKMYPKWQQLLKDLRAKLSSRFGPFNGPQRNAP